MTHRPEFGMVEKLVASIRSAGTSSKDATDALRSFVQFFEENYDRIRALPSDVRDTLDSLHGALKNLSSSTSNAISDIDDAQYYFLSGRKLNREQFYFLTALGVLNYTNKSVGLSKFNDYDVYCFFCYEDDNRYAIIDAQKQPERPVKVTVDEHGNKCMEVSAKVGAFEAPEDLSWDRLSSMQQSFFEENFPDVASRFAR